MTTTDKEIFNTRTFEELIAEEVLSQEMADLLISASDAGANILILGDRLGHPSYGQRQLLNSFSALPSSTRKIILSPKFLSRHSYATGMTIGRNISAPRSYRMFEQFNPSRILFDGEYYDLFESADFPIPKTAALETGSYFKMVEEFSESSTFPYDLVIELQTPYPDSPTPNFRISCIHQMVKAPITGKWTWHTLYAYRNWQTFTKVDAPTRYLRRKISDSIRAKSLGKKEEAVDLSDFIAEAQRKENIDGLLNLAEENLPKHLSEKDKAEILSHVQAIKEIISKQ